MSAAISITETPEQKLERLREARETREKERKAKRLERDIEREELTAKFEVELGAEGSEFAIIDTGHLEDPLVVVKRPLLVQWTKYEQTKQTPVDRYDFVAPSVVHPSRDEFNALREKRIGAEIQCSNAMARLMGLRAADDAGK